MFGEKFKKLLNPKIWNENCVRKYNDGDRMRYDRSTKAAIIDYSDLKEIGNTGIRVPAIGVGTWGIGGLISPEYSKDKQWIETLKAGINMGLKLIDTAEIYGGGHTEELVGEAIKSFNREEIFIISKVSPNNLRREDLIKSVKRSLGRLKTKYIDIYLIHWPEQNMPLREAMKTLENLVDTGFIRYIGVSNFNLELLEEARSYLSKYDIVVNQVKYNLLDRTIEKDLLPYCLSLIHI